jgi:hypothetical protein
MNASHHKKVTVLFMFFAVLWLGGLSGDPVFGQERFYVSSEQVLYEYTMDGVYAWQTAIPTAPGCCGESRDLIHLGGDSIAVYNGTFSPILSEYDINHGAWTSRAYSGWSTVNNVSYGGIALYKGAIYVTDMYTASPGTPKGIVRFDADGVTVNRYFTGTEYIDVSMGLDGKMYALRNYYGDLDVIDPETMTKLYMLDLGHTSSIRGVAVDSNGDIYGASWDGKVYRYDAGGVRTGSISTTLSNPTDIDIDLAGRLLIGSRFGKVALTDVDFSFLQVIDVMGTSGPTFVAFGPPAEFAPWQENANGILYTDENNDYAMGYHFTPLTAGRVTKLGGFFNGSKVVRLFNKDTGQLLAETVVNASNDWQYGAITPVQVTPGVTYTVAVYLAGSGGSSREGVDRFPRDYGDIRIVGSTLVKTSVNPSARPTKMVKGAMYGQADIKFLADQ